MTYLHSNRRPSHRQKGFRSPIHPKRTRAGQSYQSKLHDDKSGAHTVKVKLGSVGRGSDGRTPFYNGFAMAVKVRRRQECEADGKWWRKGAHLRTSYGGQGLSRSSAFVPLRTGHASEVLRHLFDEHIEGFSGKPYAKAVNRQRSKSMLWRTMQKRRVDLASGIRSSSALDKLSSDKRVEALINLM